MTDLTEKFAMSKYASTADRNAAMLDEIEHLALDLHTERAAVAALRETIAGLRESANLRVRYHAAELADVTAGLDHVVEQAARNADEVLRLREQLEGEYDRGYQAAMQRQAVEVDALIAQWPRATPKGKK